MPLCLPAGFYSVLLQGALISIHPQARDVNVIHKLLLTRFVRVGRKKGGKYEELVQGAL